MRNMDTYKCFGSAHFQNLTNIRTMKPMKKRQYESNNGVPFNTGSFDHLCVQKGGSKDFIREENWLNSIFSFEREFNNQEKLQKEYHNKICSIENSSVK